MDKLTTDDLANLAEQSGDCLLSLLMPTERSGAKVQQNRIRFKNLIDEASEMVDQRDEDCGAVVQQLQKLRELESDDDWWQHQSDGLAIFLDGEQVRRWRIPQEVESLCICSDKFYVRPLCRLLQNDGRFYILAVSQNDVRLFLGTKTTVAEVESADMPDDLRSALNIDEYVSSLQLHSAAPDGSAMFHGHGGNDPDVTKQDEIKQYFHHIEAALNQFFGIERTPLVFAGVEYLFPIFQGACDYNGLIDEPVAGNPDELSGAELHAKAWPLVEKSFDLKRSELLERLGTALSQNLGSKDTEEILSAAKQGQVDTLLTVENKQRWTAESSERVDSETEKIATGEDLANSAVVATLRNSGNVFTVSDEQLDAPVAAIFRYPRAS